MCQSEELLGRAVLFVCHLQNFGMVIIGLWSRRSIESCKGNDSSCGICGRHSKAETYFTPSASIFLRQSFQQCSIFILFHLQ